MAINPINHPPHIDLDANMCPSCRRKILIGQFRVKNVIGEIRMCDSSPQLILSTDHQRSVSTIPRSRSRISICHIQTSEDQSVVSSSSRYFVIHAVRESVFCG